ncbi:MAG: TlpA family protein disulfide reductase [Planctomycetes bacterium]|nr:TlpA family protein disulfide reductase [Planctomycetota bacterium]MCH9727042.1 TlpA family protein disulfide reductase [Planctomycetota bacterium]MCH9774985.1 TlpA family protein disulfide reductase [Planctomycetota bacterium]
MRTQNYNLLITWLLLLAVTTGCSTQAPVAKTTNDSTSTTRAALQDGWQKVIVLPAVLDKNDDVIYESATLKLWVEDQWLIANRTSSANELEWQVVLAKSNIADTPTVEAGEGDGRCEVSYGKFFIRESLGELRISRQKKIEGDNWPSLTLETERDLASARMVTQDVELKGQQKGDWAWVSSGLNDDRHDLWLRLEHQDLKGKGYGSQGGRRPAKFFYGKRHAEDDGQLFIVSRSLNETVEYERNKQKVRKTLGDKLAPELSFVESHNTPTELTLSNLQGKPVLLDFWGMWCRPCVANLPKVEALYQKYRDRGFTVVGVHSSNGRENLREFLVENKITFPVVVDQGDTVEFYAVDQFPSYFLIDKAGKVVKGFASHPPTTTEI